MRRLLFALALLLCVPGAEAAKDRSTFRFTPTQGEERPVVVEAMVGPQGSDIALKLRFNKAPFGPECGMRCANATLLFDSDSNTQSGVKLAGQQPENGADLAIIVQGTRDLAGAASASYLRVKVRRLSGESQNLDDGDLLAELDHRVDTERVHVEGNTVFLLIDAGGNLPSGRKARVIYHPVGAKAIQAQIPGLLSGSASNSKVKIFRKGS
ncbi:hypothetical protein [Archangium primigenium]|uniref:hypothetical protein n=1 Tax=[Archangium] primigenium TaxID=2792470 RepID=UPI001EF7E9A0|nr:hypothetical protein [Archangium primigenium]